MRYRSFAVALLLAGCAAQPAPTERPNILFAIADDASWQHFGAYGIVDWVETPHFDRVAREGLLFNRAYTPNAKCAPSRAVLLTGRNPWQLDEAVNHVPVFPEHYTTYPEALAEHGYSVGFTAKGWAPGVAERDGVPRQMTGQRFNMHRTEPPTPAMSNIDYAANFATFLDSAAVRGEPFAFWYGGLEPHRRYTFGSGEAAGGKSKDDIDAVPGFWPDRDSVRTDMLDYAFEIEYFDDHLGRMLAELDARGLLGNTVVVVTADNGMPFPRVKGQVYEMDHHLPLAVMWPEGIASPGRSID
ncbi:MAG: sulfatase-like hydrolase/transferase, partial [Bacteroidota bacterium]